MCNNASAFNDCNILKTGKRLHQGYCFHKLLKTFNFFYYRYNDFVDKYNSTVKVLIKKDISHPCVYGDVINKATKFISDTSKLFEADLLC